MLESYLNAENVNYGKVCAAASAAPLVANIRNTIMNVDANVDANVADDGDDDDDDDDGDDDEVSTVLRNFNMVSVKIDADAPQSIENSAFKPSKSTAGAAGAAGAVTEEVRIGQLENTFTFLTFVMLGTAAMSFWNGLIGILYSVQTLLLNEHKNISDTITAIYTTMALIVTAMLVKFQIVDYNLIWFGGFGFAICALIIATACQTTKGITALVIFHSTSALAGCFTAVFESSMFGFASILPRNYVGGACLGLGLSGLVSFLCWMLFSKCVFNISESGVKAAVWAQLSLVAGINLVSIVMFYLVLKKPWVRKCVYKVQMQYKAKLKQQQQQQLQKRHLKSSTGGTTTAAAAAVDTSVSKLNPYMVEYRLNQQQQQSEQQVNLQQKSRNRWDVLRDCSEQIFNVSFTLWLTLMMFPNIAPFSFGRSVYETDILMGIWQAGDFIGRYMPNLRLWIPSFIPKPKTVKFLSLARLAFVPLFVLTFRLPEHKRGILDSFWFQACSLLLFVFLSGLICSLSSMYVPECVSDAEEKSQAATFYLLFLLLGLSIGIWMSKLFRL